MSLTSAVAASHAAAAAGSAGKKAAQVQLQAELNTDDEWHKFMQREGLLVVDVYSEWCGPCLGMVGNLKKIKVELGGDNLHLAVAKSDTIEVLKRFRNRSEPTWMFIAGGQLINVVFGADAPRLTRTIEQELKKEELVKKGDLTRERRAPHDLTPQEQEKADAQAKILEERKQKEKEAAEANRLARREARAKRLESHFAEVCPVLLLAHAQKHLRKVTDALEPFGVTVADKCPLLVGKEGARGLAIEEPELATPTANVALAERPSLALLVKKLPDKEGEIIALVRKALFGDGLEEEPPKKLPARELTADGVPGLYAPKDRHERAAALDLLFPKMVGMLVEPPAPPEPPHVAMVFGAWQRRAVLAAASAPGVAPLLLKYGFFADANVAEPKLVCKTIDKYEETTDRDYCETIVLMVATGPAEPALAPGAGAAGAGAAGAPAALRALGPLHASDDSVLGAEECARFFPPGYIEPKAKDKPKLKKRKKKRQQNAEENGESSTEGAQSTEGGEEGDTIEGEEEEEEGGSEEQQAVDKATSPPPATPH